MVSLSPNSFGGHFAPSFPRTSPNRGCDTREWSNLETNDLANESMKSSTATRTEAYVDTSALIAFADRSDSYHGLFRRLFASPPRLVTTTLVISEGHAWFLRRYDRYRALQFLGMIEAMSPLRVLATTPKLQSLATENLRRFSDQNLTLVDAVGLQVMDDRGIQICWSTDFHLGLGGASLAIHQG